MSDNSDAAAKVSAGEVVSWALVAAWACFIFFMSAHTGTDFDQGTDFVARVKQWLSAVQLALLGADVDVVSSAAHFCEYLIFGMLLRNALGRRFDARRALVLTIAVASLYGVTDEIHQIFVPGRCCDPVDWAVDTAGATLGAFACATLFARRRA